MNTFYPRSNTNGPTMTVSMLMQRLMCCTETLPVIFQSPKTGAFGSETYYTIDGVKHVSFDRYTREYPASPFIDEDGEPHHYEAWTQVFEAWEGIAIY